MIRKNQPRVIEYHAVSYALKSNGEICMQHIRLDPSTGRLVTSCLGHYLQNDQNPDFPTELLSAAILELEARHSEYSRSEDGPEEASGGAQLPLWS